MIESLASTLSLPFIQTADHYMPHGRWYIRGSGILFTRVVTDSLRAGGFWLIMQDSQGKTANHNGDIMTLASIRHVDWLSESQIKIEVTIEGWAKITAPNLCTGWVIEGRCYPLWPDDTLLADDDLLVTRLQQWFSDSHCANIGIDTLTTLPHPIPRSASWVCWRWLEILPVSLTIKQRLLKHPTPNACMRYIKKIILHSDLQQHELRY
ncbi:hypothetical protein C9I98_24195 [Photobacterium sanctipauli]|uniref:Lon protease n=1 Tax=Photobacterium sanctipauli TaxID=1342794 RepID=A0A2T3NBN0_9GAMM|nr:hypothetical protein [Photobacterium sanctipauli]PSW11353.1 hypothetical protein C9I98_24195 [Photobacterium sanctipauli]